MKCYNLARKMWCHPCGDWHRFNCFSLKIEMALHGCYLAMLLVVGLNRQNLARLGWSLNMFKTRERSLRGLHLLFVVFFYGFFRSTVGWIHHHLHIPPFGFGICLEFFLRTTFWNANLRRWLSVDTWLFSLFRAAVFNVCLSRWRIFLRPSWG